MTRDYDPYNWFWVVAGDESRWWSSKGAAYVQPLQSWLDAGYLPTRIASEAELAVVLSVYPLPPPTPTPDQVLTGKIFANARRKAIITAIQTSDDVQLAALIAARYPTLSGDAIKAITDIFLTIAGYIRS